MSPRPQVNPDLLSQVETQLQLYLSDVTLNFPIEGNFLYNYVSKQLDNKFPLSAVEDLLQKFAAQQLIRYL